MRTFFALLLCATALNADFSYQSRIQVTGGALYDALSAGGPHGHDPLVATHLIKGLRMATLTRQHTSVVDVDAGTITEIDFVHKTYSVTTFDQMKKILDDAEARGPRETSFRIAPRPPIEETKPLGILNASESMIDIVGASGAYNIDVDTWLGTIPGYSQVNTFLSRLGTRLGYAFAMGISELALRGPQSLQGFDEAVRQLNQATGAPFETTIKISTPDKVLAEASIRLSNFGAGAQDATKFMPPAAFKKTDAGLPPVP